MAYDDKLMVATGDAENPGEESVSLETIDQGGAIHYDVVSKESDGLCPQLPNETATNKYLRQDGQWAQPENTTYDVVSKNSNGLCPQLPNETATSKYLRQDGTWNPPENTTYDVVSKNSNGLCPQLPNETTTKKFLRQDGSWAEPSTGGGGGVVYATCPTAASTAAKIVTTTDGNFTLTTGASVFVKFTYQNTASSPTLTIDGQTAKSIMGYGSTKPIYWWMAGDIVEFVYDGTYFIMQAAQGQIRRLYNAMPSYSFYWSNITSQFTWHANVIDNIALYNSTTGEVIIRGRTNTTATGNTSSLIVLTSSYSPDTSYLPNLTGSGVVSGAKYFGTFSGRYVQSPTTSTPFFMGTAAYNPSNYAVIAYYPNNSSAYGLQFEFRYFV